MKIKKGQRERESAENVVGFFRRHGPHFFVFKAKPINSSRSQDSEHFSLFYRDRASFPSSFFFLPAQWPAKVRNCSKSDRQRLETECFESDASSNRGDVFSLSFFGCCSHLAVKKTFPPLQTPQARRAKRARAARAPKLEAVQVAPSSSRTIRSSSSSRQQSLQQQQRPRRNRGERRGGRMLLLLLPSRPALLLLLLAPLRPARAGHAALLLRLTAEEPSREPPRRRRPPTPAPVAGAAATVSGTPLLPAELPLGPTATRPSQTRRRGPAAPSGPSRPCAGVGPSRPG